jgi:hypothetical protein
MIQLQIKGQTVFVDDADAHFLFEHAWSFEGGYLRNRQLGLFHNLIFPAPESLVVDHIDQNKLNNQRSNLRHVTRGINRQNSKQQDNISGYRGVYLIRKTGHWQATVRRNKININLGTFANAELAQQAVTIYKYQHGE